MNDIRIEIDGDFARVFSPYNREFIDRIKNLIGGTRWSPDKKCWEIPANAVETCREIMLDVYGETDVSASNYVDLKLTFANDVSETLSAVRILGKTICGASGRDSGGRAGNGVLFVKGHPKSGGSCNNWKSIVPAGSVVIVSGIPEQLYKKFDPSTVPGLTIEEVKQNLDERKRNLLAERERLLKRIEEINKELGE